MHKFMPAKFAAITLFACTLIALADAQGVTLPRPSPASTVSQVIGISTVTVNYSRPYVKGREIWGALVPYGFNVQGFGAGNNAPWRAGANENTVIKFSHDVKVQGQTVPAGSYGLTFVINKDNTGMVILSKDYRSWGSFWYDSTHDQMRAAIQLRDNPFTEQLTYDFINVTGNTAELVLNWEKKQFPVKLEFDVNSIVMANAVEELKNTAGFNWQGYQSAANYAQQNNINLQQALAWSNTAVAMNENFATLITKADILKQLNRPAEADTITTKAYAVATENELNNYGYQLIANGKVDEAIEALLLNTKKHPESANVWDSLGEAYATKGDKKNAIASFKKSLSMNPPPIVKANSEKFMQQLGGK